MNRTKGKTPLSDYERGRLDGIDACISVADKHGDSIMAAAAAFHENAEYDEYERLAESACIATDIVQKIRRLKRKRREKGK